VIAAVCTAGVLLTGWWAINISSGTLPEAMRNPRAAPGAVASNEAAGQNASAARLDLAAFRAPLWVAPPLPPAPPAPTPATPTSSAPKPPPPPPPLKWQLLAIIAESSEGGVAHAGFSPRAMLYDPETDAILELAAGDRHAGRSVESITQGSITIRTGAHTHTLTLERPTANSAGSGGNSR
jgi:hypothetical protein